MNPTLTSALSSPYMQAFGPAWNQAGVGPSMPANGATAAAPSIGGSAPATGGAAMLSPAIREQMQNDPRLAMAAMFAKQGADTSPAKGGIGEALARVVEGAIAGHEMGGVTDDYKNLQSTRNSVLQDALSQTDPNKAVAALAANPSTSDIAASMGEKMFDINAANAAKANEPITPYQRASMGGEVIYDPNTNRVIPKYQAGAGMSVDAQGNPVAAAPAGTGGGMLLPPPAAAGGPAPGVNPTAGQVTLPSAQAEGQKKLGENLASVAVPEAGTDPLAAGMSLKQLIAQAKEYNKTAPGGMIKGPVDQFMGRLTDDAALQGTGQIEGRNAYANLKAAGTNIAAQAAKANFPQRVTNADVMISQLGNSLDPEGTQSERGARLDQMGQSADLLVDRLAINKGAAMEGATPGPGDVKAYYLGKGLDPDTLKPVPAQPMPDKISRWLNQGMNPGQPGAPATPQATQVPQQAAPPAPAAPQQQPAQPTAPVRVASPSDALKLPRGTHFIDPNGVTRVVP